VGFGCSVRSLNKEQSKKSKSNNTGYHINSKVLSAYEKNKKLTPSPDFSKRRDLYNRQNLLQNSLEKVNELPKPDKDDILIHIQHLTDNRMTVLTIIRNISILLTFRNKLGKPFKDAAITDMRSAFIKIETEGWKTRKGEIKEYSVWADKKFRDVIKKFYKVVFGNDEYYPDVIKWIKTKFTKDKSIKKLDMKNHYFQSIHNYTPYIVS
jgi:hypothetical protein